MCKLTIVEIAAFKNWGGKEKHIIELSEGLEESGHSVVIIARHADLLNTPHCQRVLVFTKRR